jgi:hypothetical protein
MDIITERTYGDPLINHARIADLWNAYLELDHQPLTAHDVAICMLLVKISRAKADPTHLDSYVDMDGYARIAALAAKEGLV